MYPNLQTKTSKENQSDASETNPWLSALDQYLGEVYADAELSVRDMAENMGLSERQFYRKVKQLTGQTPLQYIRNLRLQRAKELLEAGQVDTVNELAAEVGYIRTDYFSRLFKKAFGFSPYQQLRD